MKVQFLFVLLLFNAGMTVNAQIYTPNGLIHGATVNNNVGIGSAYFGGAFITPVEKLTIGEMGGNFAVQDRRTSVTEVFSSGYKFYDFHGESAAILLEHNGYIGNSNRALKFSVNGIERLRVNSIGFVGIGISNPKNELDVNGTIHAKEVKVDLSEWADFVFAPNYEFPSLAELESYILSNGKLPDIPSATEVEKNGINLGDMQVKLLQKIEELTLYTIEQQKLIDELRDQNSAITQINHDFNSLKEEIEKLKAVLK